MGMWPWIGVACSLAGAVLALRRAHAPAANFYEREIYDMTPRSHRLFTLVSTAFALAFLAGAFVPGFPATGFLAVYAVLLIGYLSSFVRGATGEDE